MSCTYTIMHIMRIVCILSLLPPNKKQVAVDKWSGKAFILCLHIIPVDHVAWVARWKFHRIRRLIAWRLGWLKAVKTLSEWKKMNRNTLEILGSWRFFHVFSLWNLLNSSWQLWKHPTSKSGLFQLPCRHLGVVMVLLSQGATAHISRGQNGIQWFHQPFQTTSNHLNIQFQPLKTSLTNRLDQSNLLKYTGDSSEISLGYSIIQHL